MSHPQLFSLLAGLLSTGSGIFFLKFFPSTPASAHVVAAPAPSSWQAAAYLGESLGAGTLLSSRSYALPARSAGHVSQLYFQANQQVRQGEVLLKLSSQDFVVAPADGIITQVLVGNGDYVRTGAPVATFVELGALQLRLPRTAARQLRPGQFVQVQAARQPSQGLTARVVSSRSQGEFVLADLRLRTSSAEPLAAGAAVQVHALRL